MFEFLFKRPGDKTSDQQSAGTEQAAAASAQAEQTAARRAEQAERARALAGDEAGAVELILQSEFADVRLAAAAHVQSQPMLERVQQAMRNTDRRVAKLMQGRLDAIRHQQSEQRQAEASIATAHKLLQDEKLTPNMVAELDRLWKVIAATPELAARFDEVRGALGKRLEAQVALQRAALDALAAVRRLAAGRLLEGEQDTPLETLLDRLAADHASHVAAPESASFPKHLLSDFDAAMSEARAAQAAQAGHRAAFDARRAALAGWQAADPASLSAGELQRSWQGLPRLPEGDAASRLQQEFDALLAAVPAPPTPAATPQSSPARADGNARPPRTAGKDGDREANQRFMATVDALEAALEQGQLHLASEHDKTLKESRSGRLTPAQSDRLTHVRAELKRLGDWARWGGNVSREELVKAVEELPAQNLAMSELAKKVGSMRERWKALDSVSGPAPKTLWERFDSACTAAYAPAAAHFKHLADERHSNAAKAQALIDEINAIAAGGQFKAKGKGRGKEDAAEPAPAESAAEPQVAPDWKGIAAASQRLRQTWTRLGTIDRKDKKKLDAAFGKAMDAMLAPLEEQRRIEAARREQLIEETTRLNPADRHTLDTLRALQESWQEHAKALPLERKQEQALWQRFRAACDAVFAARKETAHAADHERRAHLHAREAICAQLESAVFEGDDKARQAAIAKTLREAASAWHASGSVPRASEQKIEQRYKAAVASVQAQADAIRKRAGAAQANALRDKLRLTQALEAALVQAETIDADAWEQRWKALPPLAAEYERVLHARFAAASAAAAAAAAAAAGEGSRAAYAATLEANRAKLLEEVLRLEIVAGVDSGAEFARDRLKMQVEVLQSSLKSGQKPMTQAAQFVQLCAMPALADARTASRIEQLFRRIGASEAA